MFQEIEEEIEAEDIMERVFVEDFEVKTGCPIVYELYLRGRLLKEKDLRIFVAITEKSYFFLILHF